MKAEAELARALEAAGVSGIADARASAHRRRGAELRRRDAGADLKSLAPEGIDALRDRLARLPKPTADEDELPTFEEAQQEDVAAKQALGQASEDYEAARTAHGEAETAAAATTAAAESAGTRAASALSGIDDPEAERIVRREVLSHLRDELASAIRQREEAAAEAPDLEGAKVALERARSVVDRADEDRQRIRLELGKLDTSIGIQAGEAVDEELADIDARLEAALVRAGTEEDFDILSGGAQEQVALLVRLAFARMLAKAGVPAPVILDDAIVYTDDERIERMFDVLTRQAHNLQIVVFSCRQKVFRDLGGRSLDITSVDQAPPTN